MLNDCLKSMYNAEKRGKRQVRERPRKEAYNPKGGRAEALETQETAWLGSHAATVRTEVLRAGCLALRALLQTRGGAR